MLEFSGCETSANTVILEFGGCETGANTVILEFGGYETAAKKCGIGIRRLRNYRKYFYIGIRQYFGGRNRRKYRDFGIRRLRNRRKYRGIGIRPSLFPMQVRCSRPWESLISSLILNLNYKSPHAPRTLTKTPTPRPGTTTTAPHCVRGPWNTSRYAPLANMKLFSFGIIGFYF